MSRAGGLVQVRAGLSTLLAAGLIALGGGGERVCAQEAPPQAAPKPQLPPLDDQNTTAPSPPPDEAPASSPVQTRPAPEQSPAAAAAAPKPLEPLKRIRHDAAILQATDKITAATLRFEARVGQPVRYKDLVVTVRACETAAADEPLADSIASLDVLSQPLAVGGRTAPAPREVFRGWMFASSPSLHPFEHPVYSLTLIACRTTSGAASPGKP